MISNGENDSTSDCIGFPNSQLVLCTLCRSPRWCEAACIILEHKDGTRREYFLQVRFYPPQCVLPFFHSIPSDPPSGSVQPMQTSWPLHSPQWRSSINLFLRVFQSRTGRAVSSLQSPVSSLQSPVSSQESRVKSQESKQRNRERETSKSERSWCRRRTFNDL